MTTWRDYSEDPALNTSPPPVGAPEGNFRGSDVNNIIREMMSVIHQLGIETPKMPPDTERFPPDSRVGSMAFENRSTVSITGGTINANGAVPVRGIIMFSGSESQLDAAAEHGWHRCDGRTRNGITTPDLRDKFIRGWTSVGTVGDTGGAETDTPTMITGTPSLVEGGTKTTRIDTLPPYYVLVFLMRTA